MNVAFIPVRGGSKSIPLKNIKLICGKPLVYWTVKAACGCSQIDKVYVATDSIEIKETVEAFQMESILFQKLEVIGRSDESASDTASTESAVLEFARNYSFDHLILIQATSPMLSSADLDGGFKLFHLPDTDSVLSVVRQRRFIWKIDKQSNVSPANYDVYNRPRRQNFDGYLLENGAFYITSKDNLIRTKTRVSGNVKAYERGEDTAFEIDEPSDCLIIEALMKIKGLDKQIPTPIIKMVLSDCDGCLTDGGMYYSEKGDELKKFNTRDGIGFSILKKKGIITGIVTSESVELVHRRTKKLKLDEVVTGCNDKTIAVKQLCEKYGICLENVAYIGDDLNDLKILRLVGLACCPCDATPIIQDSCRVITRAKGGEGVIREIAELILYNAADAK